MAQKEYVSPSVEVCALFMEDVITASLWIDDDTGERYTYGDFSNGWLG